MQYLLFLGWDASLLQGLNNPRAFHLVSLILTCKLFHYYLGASHWMWTKSPGLLGKTKNIQDIFECGILS